MSAARLPWLVALAGCVIIPGRPDLRPSSGAGKDTAARFFAEAGWRVDRFSAPLKAILSEHFGVAEVYLHGPQELREQPLDELGGQSSRHAQRTLGTWGREHLYPTVWADLALSRARLSGRPTVISDLRFDDEREAVLAAGGAVVSITRTVEGLDPKRFEHVSESSLSGEPLPDFIITNDGTLADLREDVRSLALPLPVARSFYV